VRRLPIKMVLTLYGDTSDANIDMLALQNLGRELDNPNVTLQDAASLVTQAANRTGMTQLQTR
jgi:hypothetical protein